MKKERYLQVFNYLKEFSKVRSKPVRDIDINSTQYSKKIWLNEIPDNELFENIIKPDFKTESAYWLKIRKPKEPKEPKFAELPKNIEKWIEPEVLLNEDKEPVLKKEIEVNGAILSIDNYPEIVSELNKYINEK